MKEKTLALYKDGKNWKVEIIVNQKQKICDSYGKICPNSKKWVMPPLAVFSHKAIEANFDDIPLNKEYSHCFSCADDILWGLENFRNGITVKNPEILVTLRQELNNFNLK